MFKKESHTKKKIAEGKTDRKGSIQEWVIWGQGQGPTNAGHLKGTEHSR